MIDDYTLVNSNKAQPTFFFSTRESETFELLGIS